MPPYLRKWQTWYGVQMTNNDSHWGYSGLRNMAYQQTEQTLSLQLRRGLFTLTRDQLSDMMFDQVWTEVQVAINSEMFAQRMMGTW